MEQLKNVPKELYRGIIIRYPMTDYYEYQGFDMIPPHKPIIDESGRKLMQDGNEYGVYMSDYIEVAKSAYANVTERDGTPLNKNIVFGYDRRNVVIPAVGIVYKINSNGINARKPWITSTLQGHYNNGFLGDEWITDVIPKENYKIDSIKIGKDNLHDEEYITIEDQNNIKEEVNRILSERRERLEELELAIENLSQNKRFSLTSEEINIYKKIFKKDGLKDIDLYNYFIKDGSDLITYLMSCIYRDDEENINFKYLKYLNSIQENSKDMLIQDVSTLLEHNLYETMMKKTNFIKQKENEGVTYTTAGFDKSIEMISKINELKHDALIRQAELVTNKRVGLINTESMDTLMEGIQDFYQRIEELYMNGSLSLQQYSSIRNELQVEFDSLIDTVSKKQNNTEEDVKGKGLAK